MNLVKDLLYNVIRIARNNGIVGNEDSILVMLNKIGLRAVVNSNPVSSNLIVTGYTGMGKDFIVGILCKMLLPKNMYVHRIHLTEKVFIYWSMDWKGKVLHFEDPAFGLLNSPIFKTIASGGRKATVVKSQDAVDMEKLRVRKDKEEGNILPTATTTTTEATSGKSTGESTSTAPRA